MRQDTKIIVGLSAFFFGFLYVVLLGGGYLDVTPAWILWNMLTPLFLLWRPDADLSHPILYRTYAWVCGTVMYALVGSLVGVVICAIRSLFKWLNDDKWLHDAQ